MPAFASLTEKLQEVFKKLRGKGKLSEADVSAALREVRLALLEADVNYKVVKDFIQRVQTRAVGQEVLESLTPAQTVVKIVHEELVSLLGGKTAKINFAPAPPTVVMLVGLQGSGKTTTAAKLARFFRHEGQQVLLVAADPYRPAAVTQLEVLGKQIGVPVFTLSPGQKAVEIAKEAAAHAQKEGYRFVFVDTAGRLHVNPELMQELATIKESIKPAEVLLVVDAMTGQDAVNVAQAFQNQLGLTGVILTKLDGDARGGAALSVQAVTGCPIKYVGVGEKLDALEPFHPDRMASRILGMGDILTLIEKTQVAVNEEKARELERKLRHQTFTLEDFLEQIQQIRTMGPLPELLQLFPGLGKVKQLQNLEVSEQEVKRVMAVIQSMTPEERRHPEIINGSRKRRIAAGSGTQIQDVNRLLKQFFQMQQLMRQLGGGGKGKKLPKKLKKKALGFLRQ